jgi:hypothetical protein
MMTHDEMQRAAVRTIREIAAMTALQTAGPNGGGTEIALMITAYSQSVGEALLHSFLTLEQALDAIDTDFAIVRDAMREIAALKEKQG